MTAPQRAALLAAIQNFLATHPNPIVQAAVATVTPRTDYPGGVGSIPGGEVGTVVQVWKVQVGQLAIQVDEDVANDTPAIVDGKLRAQAQSIIQDRPRNPK